MSRNRKILLIVFIAVSVAGMWARYSYEKSKRLKMENTLRSLATSMRESERAAEKKRAEEAAAKYADEKREMFGGELPQEYFEKIKQSVGGDFKLMSVRVSDSGMSADISTDGEKVKRYQHFRRMRDLETPADVKLIGSGKLADSLFDPKELDLSLIPQLVKEARERSGLTGGEVRTASFEYPYFRSRGEGPAWSLYVEKGEGESRQYKSVLFDAKGKFKRTL